MDRTTHGESRTKLYRRWKKMKSRCQNPNNHAYDRYGGRGIKVCQEWQKYEPFRDWALKNGFSEELTLERIDVDGDYEPSNCTWVSITEQAWNKRNTIWVNYNGCRVALARCARELGIEYKTLLERFHSGYEGGTLFSKTPLKRGRKGGGYRDDT